MFLVSGRSSSLVACGRATLLACIGVLSLLVLGFYTAPNDAFASVRTTPSRTFVANGPVYAIAPTTSAVYIGGSFTSVGPRTGPGVGIDKSTAGSTGLSPVAGGDVWAVAADGSGGFYIGGRFTRVGLYPRLHLAHILANGTVDQSFNPRPPGPVHALALSGSTLYVGGNFTVIGGQRRSRIAAIDATTGQTTEWDPAANYAVRSLAVTGSTVYAAGNFTSIGGEPRNRIAAIDAATGQVNGWNPNANNQVYALALSDQTVYAAGRFDSIGGRSRSRIAALDRTTGQATSWNPSATGNVYALAISGDTVYAGGNFGTIGGRQRNRIAALDALTGTATNWNPDAGPHYSPAHVHALAVSGQRIYAGGHFFSIGGQTRHGIAALDSTTGEATNWDPNAQFFGGYSGEVDALAVSGQTVYAGGHFNSIGGKTRHNIAALDPNTGALTSWRPEARTPELSWNYENTNTDVHALAASGDTVYAGGLFSSIGGEPRVGLAALDATTGMAKSWDPNVVWKSQGQVNDRGIVYELRLSGQTLYIGGSFNSIDGKPRVGIAAANPAAGEVTAWNPGTTAARYGPTVEAIAVSGETVYVGGQFVSAGGRSRNNIAALDTKTGDATAWNPNVFDLWEPRVADVAISGDTIFAAGHFDSVGGQTRNNIAAIDMTTGEPTGWNPNANDWGYPGGVRTIAARGPLVYAGGDFTSIGGQSRNGLAALDVTSGAAMAWNPGAQTTGSRSVEALAVAPDGSLWAGGDFVGFPLIPQSGIARFAP